MPWPSTGQELVIVAGCVSHRHSSARLRALPEALPRQNHPNIPLFATGLTFAKAMVRCFLKHRRMHCGGRGLKDCPTGTEDFTAQITPLTIGGTEHESSR